GDCRYLDRNGGWTQIVDSKRNTHFLGCLARESSRGSLGRFRHGLSRTRLRSGALGGHGCSRPRVQRGFALWFWSRAKSLPWIVLGSTRGWPRGRSICEAIPI